MLTVALVCTAGRTVTQVGGLDRDPMSEMRGKQLSDVSVSVMMKERAAESTVRGKNAKNRWSPETNPEIMMENVTKGVIRNIEESKDSNRGYEERIKPQTLSTILGQETKQDEISVADMVKDLDTDKGGEEKTNDRETMKKTQESDDETSEKFKTSGETDKLKLEIEEEEKESCLVAGISLQHKTGGGEEMSSVNQGNMEAERGNKEGEKREKEVGGIKNAKHDELVEREKEDHTVVSNLTPPSSTSQLGEEFEIPTTIEMITESQNPPSSYDHHKGPSSLLITSTPPVSTRRPSQRSSVPLLHPAKLNHLSGAPVEVKSVSLLQDLLSEVLQRPGHRLEQNELEGKANILFKPGQTETQATREVNAAGQAKQAESVSEVQAATPTSTRVRVIPNDLKTKKPNTIKSIENNSTAEMAERKTNRTQASGKSKTMKLPENDTELTVKQNKVSSPQPPAKTPSVRQTKTNRSDKNKKSNKPKEKQKKKDNRTQKVSEKKVAIAPTYFPYFMDDYCPPECACYGR